MVFVALSTFIAEVAISKHPIDPSVLGNSKTLGEIRRRAQIGTNRRRNSCREEKAENKVCCPLYYCSCCILVVTDTMDKQKETKANPQQKKSFSGSVGRRKFQADNLMYTWR